MANVKRPQRCVLYRGMKTQIAKKLALNAQTVATLTPDRLLDVVGGQRDPNPNRTKEESICWCYTSI